MGSCWTSRFHSIVISTMSVSLTDRATGLQRPLLPASKVTHWHVCNPLKRTIFPSFTVYLNLQWHYSLLINNCVFVCLSLPSFVISLKTACSQTQIKAHICETATPCHIVSNTWTGLPSVGALYTLKRRVSMFSKAKHSPSRWNFNMIYNIILSPASLLLRVSCFSWQWR